MSGSPRLQITTFLTKKPSQPEGFYGIINPSFFYKTMIKNRKHLNKIMAVVMVIVVLSMVIALFGTAFIKN